MVVSGAASLPLIERSFQNWSSESTLVRLPSGFVFSPQIESCEYERKLVGSHMRRSPWLPVEAHPLIIVRPSLTSKPVHKLLKEKTTKDGMVSAGPDGAPVDVVMSDEEVNCLLRPKWTCAACRAVQVSCSMFNYLPDAGVCPAPFSFEACIVVLRK